MMTRMIPRKGRKVEKEKEKDLENQKVPQSESYSSPCLKDAYPRCQTASFCAFVINMAHATTRERKGATMDCTSVNSRAVTKTAPTTNVLTGKVWMHENSMTLAGSKLQQNR